MEAGNAAKVCVPDAAFVPAQAVSPDAVQLVAAGVVLHVRVGVRVPFALTCVVRVKLPVGAVCAYRTAGTNNMAAIIARINDFITLISAERLFWGLLLIALVSGEL